MLEIGKQLVTTYLNYLLLKLYYRQRKKQKLIVYTTDIKTLRKVSSVLSNLLLGFGSLREVLAVLADGLLADDDRGLLGLLAGLLALCLYITSDEGLLRFGGSDGFLLPLGD